MAQQNWQRLCNARMQVQFLAQCSGLKDPVLLQLWLGFSLWTRTSICCGCSYKIKDECVDVEDCAKEVAAPWANIRKKLRSSCCDAMGLTASLQQ